MIRKCNENPHGDYCPYADDASCNTCPLKNRPKKYLVVYAYKSHSYRYSDDAYVDNQGIRNKIVQTNEDVFTEEHIKKLQEEIWSDFSCRVNEHCDECSIINIIPLNA